MLRRTPILAVALALVAAPLVRPAAARLPSDYPTVGCFTILDESGDVADPDLDLLGAALKTTSTSLKAYVQVQSLRSAPRGADGHRFTFGFTFRGHRFAASGSAYAHGTRVVRDGLAHTGAVQSSTQLTVDGGLLPGNADTGLTVSFDTAQSWVVFDLPINDIYRYGGSWLDGQITAVDVTSALDDYATSVDVDTTNPRNGHDSGGPWTVGDNRCFGAPSARLTLLSGTNAQYGDLVSLSARLQDSSGAALASRPVSFRLGSTEATATTGSDGLARVTVDPRLPAGAYPLTVSFGGDGQAGATSITQTFTIGAERTVLGVKSLKRHNDQFVRATLLDDDGRAVAGASISWTVGGANAGTAVTSSQGTAELHDLGASVVVQATFSGINDRYLPSSAQTSTRPGHSDDHSG